MATINTKTDLNTLTYEQKKEIADAYLGANYGIGWDDLPDINSLHDCERLEDIHEACDERLAEALTGWQHRLKFGSIQMTLFQR